MRIVQLHWKIAYFAVTWLVGLAAVRLLDLILLPVLTYTLIALFNSATYLGASRIFRVRGESVGPPRPWWRMTGRPKASLVIAILQLVIILGGIRGIDREDGVVSFVSNAVVGVVFATLFFNSWVRLRREKPAGWMKPSSAEWRPAPRPRALR